MIKAQEIRKYIEFVPKPKEEEWVIDAKKVSHLIMSEMLPDTWLDRVLIHIENDIMWVAKDYANKSVAGVRFDPWIYVDTLYGYQSFYLTKKELEIIKKRVEEDGYTFILGEEDKWSPGRFGACTIRWEEKK